ncbi:MAG: GNAT family N-acetyltransferase [Anaerotignum sp.]|nr:GNAT family N-acetyltransferase [Anaerotignum sp.]
MEFTYKVIKDEVINTVVGLLTEREYKLLLTGKMKGIAAFWEEEAVAVMLYRTMEEDVLSLEKLFVAVEHRRQGIGTMMVRQLCGFARSEGNILMASFGLGVGEINAAPFFLSLKEFYIKKDEGFEALLSAEEVTALHERFGKKDAKPQLYFEQTKSMQSQFVKHLEENYPLIAWSLENEQNVYRKDLCCCIADQNGIQAVCLVKGTEEMELSFLYGKPEKGVLAAKALLDMASLVSAEKAASMRMVLVNEASVKILQQMSGKYEVTKQMYTAYYFGG